MPHAGPSTIFLPSTKEENIINLGKSTNSVENNDLHVNVTVSAANRYALERQRAFAPHFHLPSFRLTPQPTPCSSKRCGWPRKDPSWPEIEEMISQVKPKHSTKPLSSSVSFSSFDLHRTTTASSITRKLDETAAELERFVADLDAHWKRSLSSPMLCELTKPSPYNPTELNELARLSQEEQMYRQKAERLTEELEAQRSRRHGYVPSATPALQRNVERFTGLLNDYGRDSPNSRQRSMSPAQNTGRRSVVPSTHVLTCTCIYKFAAHSERELSLNKGDVVRIHREIDSNWIEGERNGKIGIFPRSYVQRCPVKYRAVYPFTARNSNEMSLKVGQLVTFRREIDSNWMEGTNHLGEIGIFPSCYVRRQEDTEIVPSAVPDRPKTPHSTLQRRPPEAHEDTPEEATLCLPHPVPQSIAQSTGLTVHNVPITQQKPQMNGYSSVRDDYAFSLDPAPHPASQFATVERTQRYGGELRNPDNLQTAWISPTKKVHEPSPATIVPQNSETYRALFAYHPVNEDELELQVNDIVFVVEKCDDGWFIGTLLRTGEFGTFPGNYVVRH